MITATVLVQHCPSCNSPISEKSFRDRKCEYCSSHFFIPDAVESKVLPINPVPESIPLAPVAPVTPVVEPVKPKKRNELLDFLSYISENAYRNLSA